MIYVCLRSYISTIRRHTTTVNATWSPPLRFEYPKILPTPLILSSVAPPPPKDYKTRRVDPVSHASPPYQASPSKHQIPI
ncbi:hypothetical protein K505DRAFT_36545 [Melanomma pulvis-pyrius CBS 109.77]|uniref:Uncharacterized protein n=1 Tax=Melanomma pulvis-pyrius CBS 109.77 TaxID=1314802 RepID=A0A6A6XUR2_9PLEO|nr:hypothetical protein K505DRAFT_36545 [Melanomma pulvis-pyrius CBS 109.77]